MPTSDPLYALVDLWRDGKVRQIILMDHRTARTFPDDKPLEWPWSIMVEDQRDEAGYELEHLSRMAMNGKTPDHAAEPVAGELGEALARVETAEARSDMTIEDIRKVCRAVRRQQAEQPEADPELVEVVRKELRAMWYSLGHVTLEDMDAAIRQVLSERGQTDGNDV